MYLYTGILRNPSLLCICQETTFCAITPLFFPLLLSFALPCPPLSLSLSPSLSTYLNLNLHISCTLGENCLAFLHIPLNLFSPLY